MIHALLFALTDLGDSAVTSALSCTLVLYFLITRNKQAAYGVAFAFLGAATLIGLAKIAVFTCDDHPMIINLRSPSGHSGISAAVYGTFALILGSTLKKPYRTMLYIAAGGLVLAIASSRYLLQFHSRSDILVGLFIGILVCLATYRLFLRNIQVVIRWPLFGGMLGAALLLAYGFRLPAENIIDSIALRINTYIGSCR